MIWVYLQNDHHNQDNKNIHYFKNHIMPFVISLPLLPCSPWISLLNLNIDMSMHIKHIIPQYKFRIHHYLYELLQPISWSFCLLFNKHSSQTLQNIQVLLWVAIILVLIYMIIFVAIPKKIPGKKKILASPINFSKHKSYPML